MEKGGQILLFKNCDFYLSIGSRLPFMVTGYNAKKFASRAKFKAMVDIDKNELKKNDLKINLKVQSDAKQFIEKLNSKLKNYNTHKNWIQYCVNIRKKYPILIKKND